MLTLAVTARAETFERIRKPLAQRNIEVKHLNTTKCVIPLHPDESPWGAHRFDVGFVFPPRPMEGGVVNTLLSIPWVNDREAVLISRNKAEVLATLAKEGLPTPQSILVSNPVAKDEHRAVFERFDPPVVIKPNSTTRGVGVVKTDDLDSFLGIVDYLELIHDYRATEDKSFLVQEFVPNARDYRVMVLNGTYAGAVERRFPTDALHATRWKHNVHRGAIATGITLPDDLKKLSEAAANVLDIPLLGIDLLVTDDRVVVTETNARPSIDAESKYEDGFFDRLAELIRKRAKCE